MTMKASKSRTKTIENGKVVPDSKIDLIQAENKTKIPTVAENPIKFLGRHISASLTDQSQSKFFSEALTKGLLLINKSYH